MKYKFESESEWEASHLIHAINYRMEVQSLMDEIRHNFKDGGDMSLDYVYTELGRMESEYPIPE